MNLVISADEIQKRIFVVRGHKVMLDHDLAELYQVPTKRLNEQVRRNRRRFPSDFMFRLTPSEAANMRSQFATGSKRNLRYAPLAFTEHGVAMLSSVLNTRRAIDVNLEIIRAFIKLRELLSTHKSLAEKFQELEKHLRRHDTKLKDHTLKIRRVFDAIYELMEPATPPRKPIGFRE